MDASIVSDRQAFLARALRAAVDGPAWHGPALTELLGRFDERDALLRPFADGRSAWELLAHVALWAEISAERLHGRSLVYPGEDVDWASPPRSITADDWTLAAERARAAHLRLAEEVLALPARRLSDTVAGQEYDIATMLHGVVEHTAYHGGQLALLRRALDSRR